MGTNIKGVQDSLWGGFNAALEYIDHHQSNGSSSLALGLFRQRAAIKKKAFDLAVDHLTQEQGSEQISILRGS